jgi:hypothetical protein
VLAMLHCWIIMVPLNMLDGFDDVLSSLRCCAGANPMEIDEQEWCVA